MWSYALTIEDNHRTICHALFNTWSTACNYWQMNFKEIPFLFFLLSFTTIFVVVAGSADWSRLDQVCVVLVITNQPKCIIFISFRELPRFWARLWLVTFICTSVPVANLTHEEVWRQPNVVFPIFRIPKKKIILSTTTFDETVFGYVLIDASSSSKPYSSFLEICCKEISTIL